MVELQPYSVGILEQQRIISRRPLILARRANDGAAKRTQEAVQFINVGPLAGAKAEMVEADAILLESATCMLRRRCIDPDRGATADAVIGRVGIDHRLQPKKRQQLAIEFAGAFKVGRSHKNMRDAVDFHLAPFVTRTISDKQPLRIASITQLIRTESSVMKGVTGGARRCGEWAAVVSTCSLMLVVAATGPAAAAGCAFEPQGEGRVAEIIDARTFRLADGREVRLAGIEPVVTEKAKRTSVLSAILAGQDVTLRGEDDTPDRYGRQPAFVFLASSETSVQGQLLAQGEALFSGAVMNRDCASVLAAAEAEARQAKRGPWADPTAIKKAESPGDNLSGSGRFTVVKGRSLSV